LCLCLLAGGPCGGLCAQDAAPAYYFSLLAGVTLDAGSVDGTTGSGPVALLYRPEGVAVDSAGNVFVADTWNNRIRKISVNGNVSTVPGSVGGPGYTAPFAIGNGIAVDAAGTIYFTDDAHFLVCKLTADGVVTTVAGHFGIPVSMDGTGTAAEFSNPQGIAVDAAGNLYVADATSNLIRKIAPGGVVTTLAGGSDVQGGSADGTGSAAQFNTPYGVAVDTKGNVYVADEESDTIRMVTPAGVVTTIAGTAGTQGSADGTGAAALFHYPVSVAVDAGGNVYVCDYGTSIIRKVGPGAVVTTLAGTAYRTGSADGIGGAAEFYSPGGVAVDAGGNVYVADTFNYTVRKISPSGSVGTIAGIAGQIGTADGGSPHAQFKQPTGVAVDAGGNVYVADTFNSTIRKIPPGGPVTTLAGQTGIQGGTDGAAGAALFGSPSGVAVDSGGNLYVSDFGTSSIRKVTAAGVVSTLAGTTGVAGSVDGTGTAAKFNEPGGIGVDASGNVYVADSANNTIRKITPGGVVTTLAGTAGVAGSADGTGSGAKFNQPYGIAIDRSGNVYVGDINNNTIRKVTAAGVVTTFVGAAGVAGSTDGLGESALLNQPGGMAFDASGNLIFADTANGTIRIATPSGSVTTIAGTAGVVGSANGTGPAASFLTPVGVAVDAAGNVYVADVYNNTVRIGGPVLSPTFFRQPGAQTIATGGTVVFGVSAAGSPYPAFQWSLNGNPIAGATGPMLIIRGATSANGGSYTCAATSPTGSATSAAAELTVVSAPSPGRLVNISCRAPVGKGDNVLIAGFVVGGAGTSGTEPLLIRASGPALVPLGVSGTLPDPSLQLHDSGGTVAQNSSWGGLASLSAEFAQVGAFAWTDASSNDSALAETLPGGPYTAVVAGASGDTGVSLAEIYDATPLGAYAPTSPRLINISARVQVGTGGNILIAGFVIGGSTSKTVLIRASGPALGPLGVTGFLPDPLLELHGSSGTLATNIGWGGDSQVAQVAASVGAFSWGSSSTADSALLVTLPPGAYTAEISGLAGDTGIALVEIYEVP
jgi:sugar lactone lactonase YvrE